MGSLSGLMISVSFLLSICREPELHDLHEVLKQYLEAKGINESLANFLIQHMSKKEQSQYVNWLQKLESMVAKDD